MNWWLLAAMIDAVLAKRQAVYTSNYSTAYLLSEDSLYTLVLSGETESADTLSKELRQIQAPKSTDSNLVVDSGDNLYALSGNGCGSAINIEMYNTSGNSWSSLVSSQEGWYYPNSTAWFDSASNSILVYGGVFCNETISDGFYRYDLKSHQWAEKTSNPMPREMAYVQNIATSKDSTLFVGGRTNDGWLSMQQMAIWQYGGWSYWSVGNFTGVDSRDDAFLLPMWNNSQSAVSSILVIGGTVAGRAASPKVLMLEFSVSQGWYWTSTNMPTSNMMLTVYNSVYSSQEKQLYGLGGQPQKSISPTKLNKDSQQNKKGGLNVGSVVALSTILPLIFVILAAVAVFLWWRKRKQRMTFQPRQSQIMTPTQSLDFDNFPDFTYPPVRKRESRPLIKPQGHNKEQSHSDYDQNDIQFLVNRHSSNLRVVNPDLQEASSLSEVGTLTSESGPLLKEESDYESMHSEDTISSYHMSPYNHHRRAQFSRDLTDMEGGLNSSRSSSRAPSFAQPKQRNTSQSTFDFNS